MTLSPGSDAAVLDALAMALRSFAADSAVDSIVYDLDVVDGRKHGLFHFFAVYRGAGDDPIGFAFYADPDAATFALLNRRAIGGLPPGASLSPGGTP